MCNSTAKLTHCASRLLRTRYHNVTAMLQPINTAQAQAHAVTVAADSFVC
jgi:hypothetical protein